MLLLLYIRKAEVSMCRSTLELSVIDSSTAHF